MIDFLKRRRAHWLVIALIAVIYFVFRSDGFYNLIPEANYDDALQYSLAKSITEGHWLGKYNDLTLAKGPVYPLWLAAMHTLDIPLWLGQVFLYGLACFMFVFAVRGLFHNRWILPLIFAALVFNPMLSDRVYRDAISPSLLLLVLTWSIGILLLIFNGEYSADVRKRDFLIYTLIGAIGLPAWWYLREDSFWTAPYLIIFILVALFGVWRPRVSKQWPAIMSSKMIQTALVLLPVLAVFVFGTLIAILNDHAYGRYVVNDYTSPEFEAAYGALTRIHDPTWQATVPVSESMRRQAYKISPLFAQLRPCLDNEGKGECEGFKHSHIQIRNDDYEGGWFFWALRLAVENEGYYATPAKAAKFYTQLAAQINGACDTGKIRCDYGERSSLAPPFRMKIVPGVEKNFVAASDYFLSFNQSIAFQYRGADKFSPVKQEMADFYNVHYDSDELNLAAHIKLRLQKIDAQAYHAGGIALFILAVCSLLVITIRLPFRRRKILTTHQQVIIVAISWTLLLTMILARLLMMAYVTTTSFPAINVLYFSSLYVVLLCVECLTIGTAVEVLSVQPWKSKFINAKIGSLISKSREKGQS